MGEIRNLPGGVARAVLIASLAGLAACTAYQPAPVEMRGYAPMAAAPPPAAARQVTVQRGQTLNGIALAYHVPVRELVAANRLTPPYKIQAGMRLVIPDRAGPPPAAMAPAPEPKMASAAPLPPSVHATPLPPATPQTITTPAAVSASPALATAAARPMPDVVPLDGPAPASTPAHSANGEPPPVVAPRNAAAALPRPGEVVAIPDAPSAPAAPPAAQPVPVAKASAPVAAPPVVAAAAPPPRSADDAALGSGRFPWPVHGRILAGYGKSPDGGSNDGINIGAARGTPVRAIDAGTVAYVGNEVHGYGNLILVKHANGWISAYAHLDNVEVKVGDQIGGGQEVGKVGNTGGVIEPQLHFELRRGKQPVDPRTFLVPGAGAANPDSPRG